MPVRVSSCSVCGCRCEAGVCADCGRPVVDRRDRTGAGPSCTACRRSTGPAGSGGWSADLAGLVPGGAGGAGRTDRGRVGGTVTGAELAMVIRAGSGGSWSRAAGGFVVGRRSALGISTVLRPDGTMVRERRSLWGRRRYVKVHDPAHAYSPDEVAAMLRQGLEYLRSLRQDGR